MQTYKYIEIAKETPRNRGVLIPKEELSSHINGVPLYRSMYLYQQDAVDYADSKGNSLRSYYGSRAIDNILIDVDREQNTDDYTLRKCQSIVYTMVSDLDIPTHAFRVYFSGSGYHIVMPNSVFNFAPSEDLPYHVKDTLTSIFPDIDSSVYNRTGLYRVPHTINNKTGLYKVPLSYEEVMSNTWQKIHDKAKTPRLDFPYTELMGDGELEDKIVKVPTTSKQMGKVSEPRKVATCVQTMYNLGPQEGNRHKTLLRIVSHYRRHGISSKAAKAALLIGMTAL